ncbi:MAG: hypothetical protein DDT40_00219 [candidate division WS2 bacterium]|nr:hypothetical protein [Candidatus Psychracetigena formicireducens]
MSDDKAMSYDKEIAKRVARILRLLAEKIEENPDILKGKELSPGDIPIVSRKKKKIEEPTIDFDIFQIFAEGGEQALQQKLEILDLRTLKRIVSQHGFDTSKLAEKWRNKERLVNLILDRVSARSDKGRVFKEYP